MKEIVINVEVNRHWFNELEEKGEIPFQQIKTRLLEKYPKIEVIPRALAVGYAYEHMSEENVLVEKEVAPVYDWGEEYFSATLLTKHDGELDIMWQEVMESPKLPFMEAYEETQELVRKVIHDPGFTEQDIFNVFLSGEKTKEPQLKRWLGAFFGESCPNPYDGRTRLGGSERSSSICRKMI